MPRTLRVLVVDDNKDLVDTTVAMLQLEGLDAKPCYSGSEVFDCLREFDPDAVVLDIGLPDISGWDIARRIRAQIPGRRPLLIGMSGEFVKSGDRALARSAGFDHYLAKPADPLEIAAFVARAAH